MSSSYLAPNDYPTFGLASTVSAATITQASAAVDFLLKRPEGLVWIPDSTGRPCYMAGLTPTMTYTITGAISPGSQVPASISPPMATQDMVGDVLILDRGTAGIVEACRVAAVPGPDSVIFASVRNAHAAEATADQGLLIIEERALPAKRSISRVSRLPLAAITSVQGRYAYGRRSDQAMGMFQEINLLAAVQTFGGPPLWVDVDPAQVSVSGSTGEVWIPAGILLATYSEARIRYVAGWAAGSLPFPIKQATAQIAGTIVSLTTSGFSGSVKSIQAGDTRIVRDAASYLDDDTKAMLEPFKARIFF